MTATKNVYAAKYGSNPSVTGMSDADFYGRSPAIGIDLAACLRAAVREIRAATDNLIGCEGGQSVICGLRIKIARVKYAIAIGNESDALDRLHGASLANNRMTTAEQDAARADAAELDRAANREFAHPGLSEKLSEYREELESEKNS